LRPCPIVAPDLRVNTEPFHFSCALPILLGIALGFPKVPSCSGVSIFFASVVADLACTHLVICMLRKLILNCITAIFDGTEDAASVSIAHLLRVGVVFVRQLQHFNRLLERLLRFRSSLLLQGRQRTRHTRASNRVWVSH